MSIAPQDLAVSFRSFPRRLRELSSDADPTALAAASTAIDALVADAARLLHCPADAAAVAQAIETVANDEWTDDQLSSLQQTTMAIGAELRRLEDAATSDE
jgi:hypothetical protein